MPRSYSTRAAALTIGVSAKWLDNVLSHHELPGVSRGKQGSERRISEAGLMGIELVRALVVDLGSPIARAAELAAEALAAPDDDRAVIRTSNGLVLTIPLREISRRLRERLAEALETMAPASRGRPALP
jgi:hypothetical protein